MKFFPANENDGGNNRLGANKSSFINGSTVFIVVFAGILLSVLCWVRSCKVFGLEDTETISFSEVNIENKLKKEWSFYSIELKEKGKSEGFFTDFEKMFYGVIHLGIDLRGQYHFVSLDETGLVVRAPQIMILNDDFIDESQSEILSDFTFSTATPEEREEAYNDAKQKMLRKAMSSDYFMKAEENGRAELERVLRLMGYKGDIRITFEKKL